MVSKKILFYFYFLIVHISTNNALGGLVFYNAGKLHSCRGKRVSDFCLRFYFLFYAKKRITFYHFSLNMFSKFYRK